MLRVGDPRGWWLLALAALFLVVLLLRGRRRRVPSSLYFLIRRLAERLPPTPGRVRLLRRVALALFAAAALATALAGLEPHGISGAPAFRELAIVDLSPSLGAGAPAAPRMRELRRHLDRYLALLQDQDTLQLVTAGPQAAATPPLGGRAARAAAAALDYADAPADVAGAAALAAALAADAPFDHVLLFTDLPSRWEEPAAAGLAALSPRIVTFGEQIANAGIEAFDIEPDPLTPAEYNLYLRAACPAPPPGENPRQLTLTLLNNDRQLRQLRRACDPGSAWEELLEKVPLERGEVEVRLEPGDAYPADDRVIAGIADAPTARVVLVGGGSRFLRAALEALPGVEFSVRPAGESPAADPRAIHVFDKSVPPGALPERALFIQPDRPLDALAMQTYRTYPERVTWEADAPLLRGVDLDGLSIRGLVAFPSTPGYEVAAAADGWPLILTRDEGGRRWVVLAFDPAETSLVYGPGFPVLVANAVRWLSLFVAGERPFFRVGEAVHLPATASGGRVRTPDGALLPLPAGDGPALPFLETRHPGRYQVSAAGGGALGSFSVNVLDPAVTAAVAAPGAGRGRADLPAELDRGPLRRDYAPWLAALALALLALEKLLAGVRTSRRE